MTSAPIPTAPDPLYGLRSHLMSPQTDTRVRVAYGEPFYGILENSDYLTQICYVRNEADGKLRFAPNACVKPAPKFAIGDLVQVCRDSVVFYGSVTAFDPALDEYIVKDLNSGFSYSNLRPLTMRLAPRPLSKEPLEPQCVSTYTPSSPTYSPCD
jgi:hypothetical protein